MNQANTYYGLNGGTGIIYYPYTRHNTSNFSLSQCKNKCGVLHAFNASRRNACKADCDKEYADSLKQQEVQQQQLETLINAPTSGMSTGLILGIAGGIIFLTAGAVWFISWRKKNKAGK